MHLTALLFTSICRAFEKHFPQNSRLCLSKPSLCSFVLTQSNEITVSIRGWVFVTKKAKRKLLSLQKFAEREFFGNELSGWFEGFVTGWKLIVIVKLLVRNWDFLDQQKFIGHRSRTAPKREIPSFNNSISTDGWERWEGDIMPGIQLIKFSFSSCSQRISRALHQCTFECFYLCPGSKHGKRQKREILPNFLGRKAFEGKERRASKDESTRIDNSRLKMQLILDWIWLERDGELRGSGRKGRGQP